MSKLERQTLPVERKWFEVRVESAHRGAGRNETHSNFVFALNPIDALSKAFRIRGWKRTGGGHMFPEIRPLDENETRVLEETIRNTDGLTMERAKVKGFNGNRK